MKREARKMDFSHLTLCARSCITLEPANPPVLQAMFPSALLPAASKIQVQTILRFSIDRRKCFGGHQVSKKYVAVINMKHSRK